jgi:Arc/MetJ family transcription regulator
MKRTNLVLDEQLLEDTLRVSGERTYSAAVARALTDFVKRARAGRILELAGDLGKMRDDEQSPRPKRPKKPTVPKNGKRG